MMQLKSYAAAYQELETLLADIPESSWKYKPSDTEWSIHEVIVHLADMEINGHIRLLKALAEPGGTIMPLDQVAWTENLYYHEQDAHLSLQLFRLLRIKTAHLLGLLPADKWSNYMNHPESGSITVAAWLNHYEQHAKIHHAQISRVYKQWQEQTSNIHSF